jgi:hypothetical protein
MHQSQSARRSRQTVGAKEQLRKSTEDALNAEEKTRFWPKVFSFASSGFFGGYSPASFPVRRLF